MQINTPGREGELLQATVLWDKGLNLVEGQHSCSGLKEEKLAAARDSSTQAGVVLFCFSWLTAALNASVKSFSPRGIDTPSKTIDKEASHGENTSYTVQKVKYKKQRKCLTFFIIFDYKLPPFIGKAGNLFFF